MRLLTLVSLTFLLNGIAAAQSVTLTTSLDPPAGADALFLVTLGVGDREETVWDGSVSVRQGELVRLTGYELSYGDLVHPRRRWEARTRAGYQVPPRTLYEDRFQPVTDGGLLAPRLLLFLAASPATQVDLVTTQGRFSFRPEDFAVGDRSAHLDGRVQVERLVTPALTGRPSLDSRRGSEQRRADHDYPSVAIGASGPAWVAWQAWDGQTDRVLAQQVGGDTVHEVAGPGRDVYRTAAAFDGEGKLWVVWSERASDNWDLFGRSFDGLGWSRIERLTRASQPDAQHRLAAAADGSLHLAWQGWREGVAGVYYKRYDPADGWSSEQRVSSPQADNCWEPALAVTPDGAVFVAWDQYGPNGYDVRMRSLRGAEWSQETPLAATARFEAQVSAVADPAGRVWFAWHEAGPNWGKDFGYPRDITVPGEGLYQSRRIHLAVWENGRLREPARQLADALPDDPNNFYELPELAVDGDGRLWCFYRHRTNYEINVPPRVPSHYALWEIQASWFDGERWSQPMLLPYSTGLNDQRMRAARGPNGTIVAAWPSDRRDFRDFSTLLPDVFAAKLPRTGEVDQPRLVAPLDRPLSTPPVHPDEASDVAAIRAYEYELGGKRYRIRRGDMHRHTELSWDGYNDGSLEDVYRYAIDAAALDYLAVTEHAWGGQHPYDWWRAQKAVDLYHVGMRFTPLFGYERSVTYPNGHRNIIFAQRGVEDFDIQMNEMDAYGGLRLGSSSLFAYIRRNNGISMPHTTGTNMGTDWRDWGGELEPLVEIYQSDRNSYEAAGAWRSADPADKRTQHGGYRPDGMVSQAWAKGYRLGVQASSDHMGTHAAYAMVLSEDNTRQGLLDAIRARHAYAATDNIIVDFRLLDGERELLMGDDARITGPARFRVRLIGTTPIATVDLIKNNEVVYSLEPNRKQVEFEYEDNTPPGEEASFYYVRLRQSDPDQQLAWSSPIWISR
ncbi:MAG: hypothetical protein GC160_23070 [Acidobacteria bacterium]|nr:hypothetical protein [Acidobacteriota bacterium]